MAFVVVVGEAGAEVAVQRDEVDEVLEGIPARESSAAQRGRHIARGIRPEPVRLVVDDVPASRVLHHEIDETPQEAVDGRALSRLCVLPVIFEGVWIAVLAEAGGKTTSDQPRDREVELHLGDAPHRVRQPESVGRARPGRLARGARGAGKRCAGAPRRVRMRPIAGVIAVRRLCSGPRRRGRVGRRAFVLRLAGLVQAHRAGVLDQGAHDRAPAVLEAEVLERVPAQGIQIGYGSARGDPVEPFENAVQAGSGGRAPREGERVAHHAAFQRSAAFLSGAVRGRIAGIVIGTLDQGIRARVRCARALGGQGGVAGHLPDTAQGTGGASRFERRKRARMRRHAAALAGFDHAHRNRVGAARGEGLDLVPPLAPVEALEVSYRRVEGIGDLGRSFECRPAFVFGRLRLFPQRPVPPTPRRVGFFLFPFPRADALSGRTPRRRPRQPFGFAVPGDGLKRRVRPRAAVEEPRERGVLRVLDLPPGDDATVLCAGEGHVEESQRLGELLDARATPRRFIGIEVEDLPVSVAGALVVCHIGVPRSGVRDPERPTRKGRTRSETPVPCCHAR